MGSLVRAKSRNITTIRRKNVSSIVDDRLGVIYLVMLTVIEVKQDKLGGRGTRKQLENLLGQYDEAERKGKGREGDEKGKEREDARKKHDEEMRKLTKQAEAAEAQAGAQQDEEEDAEELASSQDKMDLSDPFLDQATKAIADPDIRKKHFHDPICFRRVRMWAGEDLTKQPAQKAQINTVLPAWAGLQRPFKHLHAVGTWNLKHRTHNLDKPLIFL
jgi:hypothetical protein